MTICNMSIEAGARAGMIAPDETTFAYLKGRPHAPEGEEWDAAVAYWKTLKTDEDDRWVKSVAAFVDGKIREAQKTSRSPDTQAVAVLTAVSNPKER